ncbi:DNA-processing protein DprA [Candidatus Wolfebacteria bacterium]|nr:DNA-processing protein DprA [Candidatus Wolfebacteria bacterium]
METKDEIQRLTPDEFPALLTEITDPPKELYLRGTLPAGGNLKYLCVVGSRKYTEYGRDACEKLIAGLRGYPVVIVSGLALGIDSIAHTAALAARLITISVPGSGLGWDTLYPRNHVELAKRILEAGGALLSEFPPDFKATPWSFPQRNRIMAGMSQAVLLIEAGEKSGTLITARLASEYNRDVLVVPGSIFAPSHRGSHQFLRLGATPITSSVDILDALDVNQQPTTDNHQRLLKNLSPQEQKVMEFLREPLPRDELIQALGMPTSEANILLSALELKGVITERLGEVRIT